MDLRTGYTKVENYFFDYVMPRVSCAEWKTICAVLRETVGWNREDAEITLDRFIQLTGFAREAMVAAIKRSIFRTVIERRTIQRGKQRTFRYRAIPKANLKALSKPDPRRHQSALPFDVLEGDFQSQIMNDTPVENASRNVTEFENRTSLRSSKIELRSGVTEFENRTSIEPGFIIDLKKEDLRETHTQIARAPASARREPVEKSAAQTAGPRVCGSKFTKKQIREYAWASHNFDDFLVDYYTTRNQPRRVSIGIQNPEGWSTTAKRTGEHDDEIQEWIDRPAMFDVDRWLRANRRAVL